MQRVVGGTGIPANGLLASSWASSVRPALNFRAGLQIGTPGAAPFRIPAVTAPVQPTVETPTPPADQTSPDPTPETTRPAAGLISKLESVGATERTGATVNEALETPLLVQVLDLYDDGVPNIRVRFQVTAGKGRVSNRGNGTVINKETDGGGYARTDFTPTAEGTATVKVSVRGLEETLEFTIQTGTTPATPTSTPDTGDPPRTTVSPVVHVGAAKRLPMLWVDEGAIYALVGADVERFIQGVDNALNIAIGGNKVYWTEKTGGSAGTINSANLDGTGVTELKSILAVPIGIAVDTENSKLYWTNSRGRIQSANLDGSGIQNVLQDLPSPVDLSLSGGNAYWTQGNGSVRFVNLTGQKQIRNISTGAQSAGSLTIAGEKVYWTEKTGESAGTVNSANLDGTGAKQLLSIDAVPMGIGVDTQRSSVYWTDSTGRIQSANLDGSVVQDVVEGLVNPGDMVLSDSITETSAGTPAFNAKYDINSDGTVDNTDANLLTEAISNASTDAKYDVNGDGEVNFDDLQLVLENRAPEAANAPLIVGNLKLTEAQMARLQTQIDLLIATGDRSPAAMRTLIYLQQLLATARPEQTRLLANYPNPFNPETWIPYELATDTEVRITIYNTQGVMVRTLELGHQSAGYYTGRDRAAYWDGRNALGEQVASGIYFYQFETDKMSAIRKMVILK